MLENSKMWRLRWVFKHIFPVINGLRPVNLKDYRNKSDNDRRGEVVAFGDDRCLNRWFDICCKFFKYPSPEAYTSTSPSRGEVYNNRHFSVINGLQPVNLKDYRNKSGNDGSEEVVAFGNDNRWECVAKRFADRCPRLTVNLTSPVSGEVTGLLRCARNDIHCLGRSMIEMLGVLTIIGVLSVAGISGYSKAMTKWKINKAINEYAVLMQGLLEYRSDIIKMKNNSGLVDLVKQLNLIPTLWETTNDKEIIGTNGENISLYMKNDTAFQSVPRILLNVTLDSEFSKNLCRELIDNLARPLHSAIIHICIYRPKSGSTDYYGDSYCDSADKICLSSVNLTQINEDCKKCDTEREKCNLAITF